MKNIIDLVTPFDFDGSIEYDGLKTLLDHLLNNNVDGIGVLGEVSEKDSMSVDEKKELIEFIVGYVGERTDIFINISGNINEIIFLDSLIKNKSFKGYILKITEGSDVGVLKYISYLSCKLNKEIIIDDFIKMSYDVIKSLSYNKNIVGYILRNDELEHMIDISSISKDEFNIYLSNDYLILVGINLGVKGIISVIGNCYPNFVRDVSGNIEYKKDFYMKFAKLITHIYTGSKVESIKYLLKINNLIGDKTRLPYGVCDKVLKRKIEEDYLNL